MQSGEDGSRSRPRGRVWKRLLGVAVGLVLLELGGRLWLTHFADEDVYRRYMPLAGIPQDERIYRGHPYLAYCLTEDYRSPDGLNRHNALGCRGEEITREKPAGTWRVLVLGGSTTYETGIADWRQTTWVEMQRLLREELGHPEVEVINAGCGGWTSWESLIDLSLRGLSLDPDLVVVLCGTNDVHARLVPPERYTRDNTGYRHLWSPSRSVWDRSLVLHMIGLPLGLATRSGLGALTTNQYEGEGLEQAWLDANPPTFYADNLRQMVALCRGQGVAVMLSTWPWTDQKDDYASEPHYQRGFEEINATTVTVARELGVPLLDHAAQMPREARYWSDGRHVNVEGGRLKARCFADYVAETFLAPADDR